MQGVFHSHRLHGATVLILLCLQACAGGLQPVDSPRESTPSPSNTPSWRALEAARGGDWFQLLNRGGEALDWRLRAIDSAVERIDLQTFIWDLDAVGHSVLQHLLAAAERGVAVRILVDDSFVLNADSELLDIDRHAGIELKVYNPYKRRSSEAALRQILNAGEFHRLDHRMHNKVMVVDNRVALLGGRNLASEYFGYNDTDNFRDMELVTGGPAVAELAAGFDLYWNNHWSFPITAIAAQRPGQGRPIRSEIINRPDPQWHTELSDQDRLSAWLALAEGAHGGESRLLLDQPPPEDPSLANEAPIQVGRELIAAIDEARDEIWLISAYLIPTPPLEAAIERAMARGAQVRILTNSINSNNHLSAHSAYRNHVKRLVEIGVDVHEVRADAKDRDLYIASPSQDKSLALHAKLMILDRDTVYIGSANLDPRSLHINTEMGLLLNSPSLNQALRSLLEPDFALRNAWHLRLTGGSVLVWESDDEVLDHQPTHSYMRRIEDWFMALLPIEGEM
jgi:putative cardiolipin synthase